MCVCVCLSDCVYLYFCTHTPLCAHGFVYVSLCTFAHMSEGDGWGRVCVPLLVAMHSSWWGRRGPPWGEGSDEKVTLKDVSVLCAVWSPPPTPSARPRTSSDLEGNHQRVPSDVWGAGLDALLVMRSAQTDGVFIQARSLRIQVKLTWWLTAPRIHS